MSRKKRTGADLFCGGGGTSKGFLNACARINAEAELLAINHCPTAIETHTLNNPGVRHLCEEIDKVNPRQVIPDRRLHLLCASPECTHHSNAAGGRPRNEQSRATAFHICRFAEALDGSARSVDSPTPTVVTSRHIGLAEPFLMHVNHHGGDERRCHSLEAPVPTLTCSRELALVEPFVIGQQSGARPRSTSKPLPTVATAGAIALVEPFIAQTDQTGGNGAYVRSLDQPVYTVVTKANLALIEPFIVKYYGSGTAKSLDQPLDTVTTRDRYMLVEPTTRKPIAELDIRFRMLQPHELAAAQGFPGDYKFVGTREQQIRQIGNAVPVNLATALCHALLE